MENLADRTLVVTASKKHMLARAAKKGIRPELASKILASQWPIRKKARMADFVILNDGTLAELEKKVLQVLEKIKSNKGEG
jgi:dephospho-CoA kinase